MAHELAIISAQDIALMAKKAAESRMFGMDEAQAFTLMMLCQSDGIHPIQALRRYHIIQGRPAMRADAMLAEFQRIGGSVEWLTESDHPELCEGVFTHPTTCPKGKIFRFSMADAKRAELLGNATWRKYPAPMLRARVVSTALRAIAPGIVAGIYTPEEVSDFATIDVSPAPPKLPPTQNPVQQEQSGHFDHAAKGDQVNTVVKGNPPKSTTETAEDKGIPGTSYMDILYLMRDNANNWLRIQSSGRTPEGDPDGVVSVFNAPQIPGIFEIEKVMCEWAMANKKGVDIEKFLTAKGDWSHTRSSRFLARWHSKYPEEFNEIAEKAFSNKLEAICKEHGISPDDGQDDVQELPETAA